MYIVPVLRFNRSLWKKEISFSGSKVVSHPR